MTTSNVIPLKESVVSGTVPRRQLRMAENRLNNRLLFKRYAALPGAVLALVVPVALYGWGAELDSITHAVICGVAALAYGCSAWVTNKAQRAVDRLREEVSAAGEDS